GGRRQCCGSGEAGDDGGVDPVGLLQNTHRRGVSADVAGVGQRTADPCLPQLDERPSLVSATGLHHHQRDGMFTAEPAQFCDACRIVIEACKSTSRFDADIEPGLRDIHSTNRLLHGNLPCPCDRNSSDCSVVRDMAKIPKLTHGCSRRGKRATSPRALAGGHRPKRKSLPSHKSWPCRYKGDPPRTRSVEAAPHPNPLPVKNGEREKKDLTAVPRSSRWPCRRLRTLSAGHNACCAV